MSGAIGGRYNSSQSNKKINTLTTLIECAIVFSCCSMTLRSLRAHFDCFPIILLSKIVIQCRKRMLLSLLLDMRSLLTTTSCCWSHKTRSIVLFSKEFGFAINVEGLIMIFKKWHSQNMSIFLPYCLIQSKAKLSLFWSLTTTYSQCLSSFQLLFIQFVLNVFTHFQIFWTFVMVFWQSEMACWATWNFCPSSNIIEYRLLSIMLVNCCVYVSLIIVNFIRI